MHGKTVKFRHCPATVSGRELSASVTAPEQPVWEGRCEDREPQVRRPVQPTSINVGILFRGGKDHGCSYLPVIVYCSIRNFKWNYLGSGRRRCWGRHGRNIRTRFFPKRIH